MQQELSHTVYQKLQRLIKEQEQLKKENHRLLQQLDEQQTATGLHNQRIKDLEAQVAILKTSAGQMNVVDKKDMERRINLYIKDIDNAIMLLNE